MSDAAKNAKTCPIYADNFNRWKLEVVNRVNLSKPVYPVPPPNVCYVCIIFKTTDYLFVNYNLEHFYT